MHQGITTTRQVEVCSVVSLGSPRRNEDERDIGRGSSCLRGCNVGIVEHPSDLGRVLSSSLLDGHQWVNEVQRCAVSGASSIGKCTVRAASNGNSVTGGARATAGRSSIVTDYSDSRYRLERQSAIVLEQDGTIFGDLSHKIHRRGLLHESVSDFLGETAGVEGHLGKLLVCLTSRVVRSQDSVNHVVQSGFSDRAVVDQIPELIPVEDTENAAEAVSGHVEVIASVNSLSSPPDT